MAATREDIKTWLKNGKKQGATHVIIVCDTFDHDDYPVYVMPHQNARKEYEERNGKNMQRVMEVYNLSMDIALQMAEKRAFHFEDDITWNKPPATKKMTVLEKYQDELESIFEVSLENLPLKINDPDPIIRKIANLRLECGK